MVTRMSNRPVEQCMSNHKFDYISKEYNTKYCKICGVVKNFIKTPHTLGTFKYRSLCYKVHCYFCSAEHKTSSLKSFIVRGYNGKDSNNAICINCFRFNNTITKGEWLSTDFNWTPILYSH